jgi:hypothetical protein
LAATAAYAQFPTDFERVLLPVVIAHAEGANGARWSTSTWGFNHSDTVVYARFPYCPFECSDAFGFPEGAVQFVPVTPAPLATPGRVIEVEKGKRQNVDLTTRLGRDDFLEFPGVRMPVVFEEDLYTSRLNLLDIPTVGTRVNLRIYSPFETGQLNVRTYAMEGQQELLNERVVTLSPGEFPYAPAYSEIRDLPSGDGLIRVEIEPVTSNLRFWAFASSTEDTTQDIVLSLPTKHH